jgi:murein DD-endopeptidase MepM/ murein hydrolase activator NlpD
MSFVKAGDQRSPEYLRAAVKIGLGCVLLGGCSAGSERFTNIGFGSGYEAATPPSTAPAKTAINNPPYSTPPYSPGQQPVSYQPQPQGGYQVASANPGQTGGYLQVSRIDLPPPQQQPAPGYSGTKTADGYGRYNQPPLEDGTYTGPRVYTPYDQPRDYAPPPPPPPPPADEPGRYDREPPPPPPSFYRRSDNGAPPPPYEPRGEARVYEPRPEPEYREERRDFDRGPDRSGFYGPKRNSASPGDPVAGDRGTGKVVTVRPGDTLYALAIRHGVTVDMIVRANGLTNRFYVKPGTDLLIPGAGPAKFGQGQPGEPKAQPAVCTGDRCYTVKKGETVASIARAHGLTERQILEANNLADARSLKAGQAIVIPGSDAPRQAVASAGTQDRTPGREPQTPAVVPPTPGGTLQAPEPLRPTPEVKVAAVKPVEPTCEAALANPMPRIGKTFRKPVEGLIIGQFGPQRDGTVNEGVTISVPKGTPVKAAENGVVAYVGDELPGFGNLILIRHADEYVTAYAHADEILVKKCDVVKRGQLIAKAGATGDASQPQLHFEIRKNAKPVDPGPLLGS